MINDGNYFAKRDLKNRDLLNIIISNDLPDYCRQFFIGIQNNSTVLTRLNYAYDLRLFFQFLTEEIPQFKNRTASSVSLAELESLQVFDIENYLNFLEVYYDSRKKIHRNSQRGKARKLSSLRVFYKFFHKKGLLKNNITANVDTPKINEKEIIRLQKNEISELLDTIESGQGLTKKQMDFHTHNKTRDVALVTLLLGSGIRVSEAVGLNVNDIDFPTNSFVVTRKGGNRVTLYFGNEIKTALLNYLNTRKTTEKELLPPLFISAQNKRLTTRAIQLIVKKYSKIVTPLKKISPHKLRSTFGTQLYRETGDIYVVADVLGHKDVNTTKKHYAAMSEDIRKNAIKKIVLRPEDPGSKED